MTVRALRTVDFRAVGRCPLCGAHVDYRDKDRHFAWHDQLAILAKDYAERHPVVTDDTPPPF